MKVLFYTRVPESVGRVRLKKEMESRGHQVDFVATATVGLNTKNLESLVEEIKKYDIFHHAAGLGETVLKKIHEMLSDTEVFCVNDRTKVAIAPASKLTQSIRFVEHGISAPLTYRSDQPNYKELSSLLGEVFVAKKPQGTKGKAVWLVKDESDLKSISDGSEFIFQKYIKSDGDYRVHVVGADTAFCAYRRLSPKDDFRSNISRGATASPIIIPEEVNMVNTLAINAAKAMDLDYCGVDIIRGEDDNFYVLETNIDPGFLKVNEVTNEPFEKVIVDYYERVAGTSV